MKLTEFKKLIREEVRKVLKEVDTDSIADQYYLALENVESFKRLGMDGQGELIALIVKHLAKQGIKEGQELTEGNIMIFSYAKPYKKPDVSKIRAEADKYIKFLQSKNFNVHTGSDALYFPNFVWAGGKQQLGECIGVLAGSETIVVSPIGENKVFKFGESLLARFVKDDRIPAFLIKGSMEEGKKEKFLLYTNPGNATDRAYVAIGAADVREVLSNSKRYRDSYQILFQGSGTQDDLVKAKNMFSNYRFGDESI